MARNPLRKPRNRRSAKWQLATLAIVAGCSTVDPGGDPQIAQVVYDEDFFYCQVLPKVVVAKSCALGDPALDSGGGCHASAPTLHLQPLDMASAVKCDGDHVSGDISAAARSNYGAAQVEMSQDPEQAPLLTHPTKRTSHPRQIFDVNSDEANLIRQWAQRSSR